MKSHALRKQQIVPGAVRADASHSSLRVIRSSCGPAEPGRARRAVQSRPGEAALTRRRRPRAQTAGSRQVAVEVVAGEQLVSAEPGQHHTDVLTDEAMQEVELQLVDLRLLGVPDGVGEMGQGRLPQHQLVMVGAERLGHEPGIVRSRPVARRTRG